MSIIKEHRQAVISVYAPMGLSHQTGKYNKIRSAGNVILFRDTRIPENQFDLVLNDIMRADTQTDPKTDMQYVRLFLKTRYFVIISGASAHVTASSMW